MVTTVNGFTKVFAGELIEKARTVQAEWADALDLAGTPEQFSAAVLDRLRTGTPAAQVAARQRLALESWDAKARAFEEFILGAPG